MDGPDYPQDERPGTSNDVPALIHDYRAQREAWREQARNLARMREEVLTAADREAKDIVSTARADVRRILLKARRDLLVLAAQVRAAGRLGEPDEAPDTIAFLPADDLGQVGEALTSARHDVRRVLDESRPELDGLASEGEALRAALRQRPGAPRPADVRRQIPTLIHDVMAEPPSTPVDFEFTTIAADAATSLNVHAHRPLRVVLVAAAMLGGIAVMGTAVWLYRPQETAVTPVGEPKAAERTSPPATPSAAKPAPPAARTTGTVSTRPGFVSLNVAATRSAWIRVTVDGRVSAERIFKAGETQQVRNAREVSVRAGDAGAVTVSVDGRQAMILGREGEVVTRRFAAEPPRTRPTQSSSPAPAPVASVPVATSSPQPQAPAATPTVPQSTTSDPPLSTSAAPPAAPSRTADVPAASAAPSAPTRPAAQPSAATSAAPAPVVSQASLQDALTNTAARWLDAYYRQDRATMTAIAPQANVSDDRADKERLPRGLSGVRRSIEDVKLQVVPSGALLTARMTERMEASGQMAQAVSFVSNMWEQRNGSWHLIDVRIISASTLSRALR